MNRMFSYSFRTHLQLELFREVTVSQRFSILARMSRGVKSSFEYQNDEGHKKLGSVGKEHHSTPGGQNSPQKLTDVSEEQNEFLFNSANEHEFPSISASSSSKSKRINQTEGNMGLKQILEQGPKSNSGFLGAHSNYSPHKLPFHSVFKKKQVFVERSSQKSSSYTDESSYPTTGFQEGQSHSASGRPNLEKNGPQGRSTPEKQGDTMYRPFDICFYTRKQPVIRSSVIENGEILRPGMVLLRSYIPIWQQAAIILRCRELGLGPGGFYRPGYKDGAKLCLQMMCLG